MIFILRGFVIIMNNIFMIKHAAELEAVHTSGWRQRPANHNAVYFIIIH